MHIILKAEDVLWYIIKTVVLFPTIFQFRGIILLAISGNIYSPAFMPYPYIVLSPFQLEVLSAGFLLWKLVTQLFSTPAP